MAIKELTPQERIQLRSERSVIVQEQARSLLRLCYRYRDNIDNLRKQLSGYRFPENKSFKAEAVKFALEYMEKNSSRFSQEMREAISDFFVERSVGTLKERPLEKIAEKTDGINSGRMVSKPPKNQTDVNLLKQNKVWMQKDGIDDVGEIFCELISTNLSNAMLGANSPKFRIHKDENGNVTVISKFLDDFKTLQDSANDYEDFAKEAKGFANFFAANALLGDYDVHEGNVGLRIANDGSRHWARIDNGRGLSFNVDVNYRRKKLLKLEQPQTAEGFKASMIRTGYDEELFKGIDFACELNQAANNIDEKRMRKIIKLSIKNLKEAYGENLLSNHKVKDELQYRMNIPLDTPLTEALIEEKIIENFKRIQMGLKKIAQDQFIEAIKQESRAGSTNYKKILEDLEESNRMPKNLELFMKHAIEANDIEGVKYLRDLNKDLEYTNIQIDGCSSLEYALKIEKNELAIKMMQEGFVLNNSSKVEQTKVTNALQNIIERKSGRNFLQDILDGKQPTQSLSRQRI